MEKCVWAILVPHKMCIEFFCLMNIMCVVALPNKYNKISFVNFMD